MYVHNIENLESHTINLVSASDYSPLVTLQRILNMQKVFPQ